MEDPRIGKKFSLVRIKQELESLLGLDVIFVDDCVGPQAKKASQRLIPGQVLLLENLRFYKEEVAGDEKFAEELSSLADIISMMLMEQHIVLMRLQVQLQSILLKNHQACCWRKKFFL